VSRSPTERAKDEYVVGKKQFFSIAALKHTPAAAQKSSTANPTP